jgi:hypothetical protein
MINDVNSQNYMPAHPPEAILFGYLKDCQTKFYKLIDPSIALVLKAILPCGRDGRVVEGGGLENR